MRYQIQYKTGDNIGKVDICNYPGDIFIETMGMWNCEDFSFELLAWCENAKVGDVFEDSDLVVSVID